MRTLRPMVLALALVSGLSAQAASIASAVQPGGVGNVEIKVNLTNGPITLLKFRFRNAADVQLADVYIQWIDTNGDGDVDEGEYGQIYQVTPQLVVLSVTPPAGATKVMIQHSNGGSDGSTYKPITN